MSLNSMLQVELDRDAQPPAKRVRTKEGDSTAPAEEQQRRTDLLIRSIPTEVLAPYTALVGGVVATIDQGESARPVLRWTLYALGLASIALYLGFAYARGKGSSTKRRFPWAGTAAAMIAFGAWGLVMPGTPLAINVSGDDLIISTLVITVGGAFLVGLMTQPLTQKVKER